MLCWAGDMEAASRVVNFLTIDVEEWYHANYEGMQAAGSEDLQTNLESLVDRLIRLCEEQRVRTTCFVLGCVAKSKPGVVRRLHRAGHEIASHGWGHEPVYSLGASGFATDLQRSCEVLENITGEKVRGYRAPSFSVTWESLGWYYDVLEEAGLAYSSSVFPGRTFLYGVPGFPERVHAPVVDGRARRIVEFPVPVVRILGREMGLYLRLFPARAITRRIASDNRRGEPVVLYAHPREIDCDQPRLDLPRLTSLIHYWGIRSCEGKLRSILRSSRFGRMGDLRAE